MWQLSRCREGAGSLRGYPGRHASRQPFSREFYSPRNEMEVPLARFSRRLTIATDATPWRLDKHRRCPDNVRCRDICIQGWTQYISKLYLNTRCKILLKQMFKYKIYNSCIRHLLLRRYFVAYCCAVARSPEFQSTPHETQPKLYRHASFGK